MIPDSPQGTDSQAQPTQPAQGQDEAVQPMKKGIYLSALIYVEGMQAPADDFASFAKSAVTGAVAGNHDGVTITLKNLHVENNVEDTGDSGKQADQTDSSSKGGFEF